MKLVLLNASVVTGDGCYIVNTVSFSTAKYIVGRAVKGDGIRSFIGHADTAKVLSEIMGVHISCSNGIFSQQIMEPVLICKLNCRPTHGRALSIDEIRGIGFTFRTLGRYS